MAWVRAIRDQNFPGSHGRWKVLSATAGNSSNNWGTFALASLVTADAYLRDAAGLARDWAIYKGYGDGSWTFQKTGDYDPIWTCGDYEAIERESCLVAGKDINGVPTEDAGRGSGTTPSSGYVNEAVQGYALQALILERAGFDAFGVNDAQFCRVGAFQQRFGIANGHSTGYYFAWVHREHCAGSSYPLPASAPFGRVFGFTDWFMP